MQKKFIILVTAIVLNLCLSASACQKKSELRPAQNVAPTDAALIFVRNLEIGINIGNTLDSIGTDSWFAGETGWGNPKITRELIKALKSYGYKTIRLPVTWAEYIGSAPNYIIKEERMSRVEEVVKWIFAENMYCIVNLHHDGGESDKSWILDAGTETDRVLAQFVKVWTQIATRFSGVSEDKLIFESMNEVGFDKIWNRHNRSGNKIEAYRIFNLLNQTFVDTVRKTKGNQNRFLLIAGYWTDIDLSCDSFFKMPQDSIGDRLIISVHYYTPSTFCIAEDPNNGWGFMENWGSDSDKNELNGQFQKLKTSFINKKIPVILGEYGVTLKNKVEEGRIEWMTAVTQVCLDNGICPILWDTGGEISRNQPYTMRDSLKQVWENIKK